MYSLLIVDIPLRYHPLLTILCPFFVCSTAAEQGLSVFFLLFRELFLWDNLFFSVGECTKDPAEKKAQSFSLSNHYSFFVCSSTLLPPKRKVKRRSYYTPKNMGKTFFEDSTSETNCKKVWQEKNKTFDGRSWLHEQTDKRKYQLKPLFLFSLSNMSLSSVLFFWFEPCGRRGTLEKKVHTQTPTFMYVISLCG